MLFGGALLFAFAVNVFLTPKQILSGGATGVSITLNVLFSIPVGLMMLIINLPLVIANAFLYGMRFTYRTLLGVILTSVLTDLLSFLPPSESETLICAALGGVCMGTGIGIMFYEGVTTGGTDLAAFLLKRKFPHVSAGKLILIIDTVLIFLCAFALSDFGGVFYSLIALAATALSLDTAEGLLERCKLMLVISCDADALLSELSDRVRAGAVVFRGCAKMDGEERSILMFSVKRTELYYVKEAMYRRDPGSVVIITDAGVSGIVDGNKK